MKLCSFFKVINSIKKRGMKILIHIITKAHGYQIRNTSHTESSRQSQAYSARSFSNQEPTFSLEMILKF